VVSPPKVWIRASRAAASRPPRALGIGGRARHSGFIPALAGFLGYLPLPTGETLAEQLVAYRTARSLSQKATARLLGIDPGTLSRWERVLRVPVGRYVRLLEAFLERLAATPPRARDL
jgi:Predicted transcriptional regulator